MIRDAAYEKAYKQACMYMSCCSQKDRDSILAIKIRVPFVVSPVFFENVQTGTRDGNPSRYDLDEIFLYNHPYKGHLVEEDTVSNFSEISDRDPSWYRENEV